MIESTTMRQYAAVAGNVGVRLSLEFDSDVATRHVVESTFGVPGQTTHHAESRDFPTCPDGFSQALAFFNQTVRSLL